MHFPDPSFKIDFTVEFRFVSKRIGKKCSDNRYHFITLRHEIK